MPRAVEKGKRGAAGERFTTAFAEGESQKPVLFPFVNFALCHFALRATRRFAEQPQRGLCHLLLLASTTN